SLPGTRAHAILQKRVGARVPAHPCACLLGTASVEAGVATVIENNKEEAVLRQWIDRLKDKDTGKRVHAASVLASLASRASSAIPALIEALRDGAAEVRRMAALALGEVGPEARAAIPALIGLLQDKSDGVRRRAVMALTDLGSDARMAASALIKTMKDPN